MASSSRDRGSGCREQGQAGGSGPPPSGSLSTWSSTPSLSITSGQSRVVTITPKAAPPCCSFLGRLAPGCRRMPSPHHPPWPLYQHARSPWGRAEAGAQEPDWQAHLALQSPPASRTQAWPVPLSASDAPQPEPQATGGSVAALFCVAENWQHSNGAWGLGRPASGGRERP